MANITLHFNEVVNIESGKYKLQCKYCLHVLAGHTSPTRLRAHLIGSPKAGVKICPNVPDRVKKSLSCEINKRQKTAPGYILSPPSNLPPVETEGVTEAVMPSNETSSNPHQIEGGENNHYIPCFSPEVNNDFGNIGQHNWLGYEHESIDEYLVRLRDSMPTPPNECGSVEHLLLPNDVANFSVEEMEDYQDTRDEETDPTNISPNMRFRRSITNWERGKLLGHGSCGSVYEGLSDDGFFFAVKEVSLLDDQGSQGKRSIIHLEQEINLLSRIEHENIVQYYGTDKDESKLYIFLELVTKGSLLNLYQTYKLRDSQVSAYTRQILHGLKYLHDQNVVHRDIKCANILVDANGSVKLADFGLAKTTKLNDVKSSRGTAFWMAPEVVNLKNQGYGLPADIWSLGCTVLEMLTRQLPYFDLEPMQALFRIGRGVLPPVPDSLSPDARDFILQCLRVNPDDRPTAAQLLGHAFVKRLLSTNSGSASPYIGRRS